MRGRPVGAAPRRWVAASAMIVGLVASACGGSSDEPKPRSTPSPSLPAGVSALIEVGSRPCAAVEGGGFMWVSNYGDGTVSKIDPATNQVVATFEPVGRPCGIVFVDGAVWVGSVEGRTLARMDPDTGEVTAEIDTDGQVYDVQAGLGSVWVANREGEQVLRVDPASAEITSRIEAGPLLYGLAVNRWGVWTTSVLDAEIIRIDPKTERVVARIEAPEGEVPYTFATADDAVWVTATGRVTAKIDPKTNRVVDSVEAGGENQPSGDPDYLDGAVWVPDREMGMLARIDPETGDVTALVELGQGFAVAQAGFGSVWVLDFAGTRVARVDPAAVG